MADDTRDTAAAPAGSKTTPAPPPPPKKLPRGMVLGKDGKPCRSCTSLADWASQSKKLTARSASTLAAAAAVAQPQSSAAAAALSPTSVPAGDCPPDVEALGRSSWTLLHTLSASYPAQPSSADRSDMRSFLSLFAKLYPCWVCAEDFQAYMEKEKVRVESREALGRWMCEAHNEVNRKLGKREFDCGRWEERWLTGWKDGSCD